MKKPHGTYSECQHPLVHNKLPSDHWEVDPLLKLLNKIKFLEVQEYSDTTEALPQLRLYLADSTILPDSLRPNTSLWC